MKPIGKYIVIDEIKEDDVMDEETGRETELWEGRVLSEEKREVQPFGCASTSC